MYVKLFMYIKRSRILPFFSSLFLFPFSLFLKFKKLSKQSRHSMQDQSDYCTRVNAALIKIVSVGESVRKIYEECHDMPREEKKNRNIQSI